MVALHNRRLTEKEIFRGVLWTEKEWCAQQDLFRKELEAEGVDKLEMIFRLGRKMEGYQQAQPSMRDRQQIMARLYPPVRRPPALDLTDEERTWLIDRLEGVNDPIGLDILEKLRRIEAARNTG